MDSQTVLVVDDDKRIRYMLCKMLKRAGYDVVGVGNGSEAMCQVLQKNIDLVITDILMPEKEGIETIVELKKTYPNIKIIAMSGGGRGHAADYLDTAHAFGAQRIFSKPFDYTSMLTAVHQLLADGQVLTLMS